jgi:large subunit ribosomal protein L24
MAKLKLRTKERTRIRLRKNDIVEVIAGRDAGKRGKVITVLRAEGRVLVQGVNFIKRHTRPNPATSREASSSGRRPSTSRT